MGMAMVMVMVMVMGGGGDGAVVGAQQLRRLNDGESILNVHS
jgi:hypothetical protein